MKIRIEIDESLGNDEFVIKCKNKNDKLENIIRLLDKKENKIQVKNLEKEDVFVEIIDIYRADTVEDKVFIYTECKVFETSYRIYELDNILPTETFCRISKAAIINILKIKTLKTAINRRINIVMVNGDKEVVNRTYVDDFKEKLEILKRRMENEKKNY